MFIDICTLIFIDGYKKAMHKIFCKFLGVKVFIVYSKFIVGYIFNNKLHGVVCSFFFDIL